jgi:TIR domain
MTRQCVISHAHADGAIARALAILIERVSLASIKVWHSSDDSRHGGIGAGDNWFETILSKLKNSRVIIALITKEGGNKPWIFFESGFAASQEAMTVIPVSIGLKDADEIPSPLSAYQAYALIDQRAVSNFLEKLLAIFDVKFDEEMSEAPMRIFVAEVGRLSANNLSSNVDGPDRITHLATASSQTELSTILSHIDRKLNDFVEVARGDKNETQYATSIFIDFPNFKTEVSISVRTNDTAQNLMDSLWNILSKHVAAYTYLETWILQEEESGADLVAREILPLVPARYIFRPELKWVAKPLSAPYTVSGDGYTAAYAFRKEEWSFGRA